ncbi:hypothetical protein PR003_g20528 [Phytophthora rubi]|uniref:Uncharacterized protein n=1 Tax=Phytophthora rubi TaxID=129364 RepID=A0A6A4DQ46_9STRA|nr:hypothetical protein PR003_g20528 [Phytophthora rubi]
MSGNKINQTKRRTVKLNTMDVQRDCLAAMTAQKLVVVMRKK